MTLQAWLQYIESLHPREMELGLERVKEVADRLNIDLGSTRIVSVAGTNGKGSCVALLEGLLLAQALRVGAYTSPHLHRYNERIRINGEEVSDQSLCECFSQVEQARGKSRLTYFEFGTLAAILMFQQAQLDVIVLEVGLGGRLDAVNFLDCDVAVITSIDLDHMSWLGETREAIAREKIGIMRPGKPLVCAERNPPDNLLIEARQASVPLDLIGREFDYRDCGPESWCWKGLGPDRQSFEYTDLSVPLLHHDLAAAALQVLSLAGLLQDHECIGKAIGAISLAGRFEQRFDRIRSRNLVFDVAHNPAAAALLAKRLRLLRSGMEKGTRTILVLAMMADKDVVGFARGLASEVDIWYIGQVNQDRCMPATELARQIEESVGPVSPMVFENVNDAYLAACESAHPEDTIVITGSFFTVAEIRGFVAS